MGQLDIVVLDAAQRSALAAVRSLGKRGIRVAAADSVGATLAGASRYCDRHFTYPDPATRKSEFIGWLKELGSAHPDVVVLPVTDVSVPATLEALTEGAAISSPLPKQASYDMAIDKLRTAELAVAAGFSAPRTHVVSSRNLDELRSFDLAFPVVVKPRHSTAKTAAGALRRTVSYAPDMPALERKLGELLRQAEDDVLLQEYISGKGAGIFALYDRGKPITFFAHKRLREKPPSGGVSVLSESAPVAPRLQQAAERLLTPLEWHGVAMIELKVSPDGRPWLMEINARLWGSVQLAIDCGVDFPYYLFELAHRRPASPPSSYRAGRRLRWELGDLDSLYLCLRDRDRGIGAKLGAMARFCMPWQPGLKYEVFRAGDPQPAWFALRRYVQDLARPR